jgi:hypothetical protein
MIEQVLKKWHATLNGNMFLFPFCFTNIYFQPYLYINVHRQNPAVLFFIQSQKYNFYLTLSIPYEEMTGIETQEE